MSDDESKTGTGKGLLETLRGEAPTQSDSLQVADTTPHRLSLETQDDIKFSLPYAHITSIRLAGRQDLRINCGGRQIAMTGYNLSALYERLNEQRVARIIEQGDETWGDGEYEDVLVTSIDFSAWDDA